ncbi:MAG: FkbM family methyltransferase, partial [Rhodospirillaceae bacterium]
SLFPPNRKLLEIFTNLAELTTLIATHAVETTRLDDVLGDQDVDLLKIDVQGSELMVFRNGHEVLARTTIVHTEVCFVELYEDQPLFAEIDQFLRKAGFQFHTFLGFGQRTYKPIICNNDINAGINQHLWSDAIYIRHSLDLPNLPLDKLVKMAILVHVLYKSYDLCHYILSEIDQQVGSSLSSAYLFFMNDSVRGSYA